MIPEDDNFQRFADTLERTIASYKQEDLTADQLLVKQCQQFQELVRLELAFRDILYKWEHGPTIYRQFITFICIENGNILTSRPFFRERQEICIGPISKALKLEQADELAKYHFNYNLVAFVMADIQKKRYKDFAHRTILDLKMYAKAIARLRKEIVELNMPLAIAQAKQFWHKAPSATKDTRFSFMDFVQIAADGLMSAVDKFVLPKGLDKNPALIRVWRAVAIGRMKGNFIEMFCIDPATRILKADLSWVRADSLKIGDELVGFDDQPVGMRRKWRKAKVVDSEQKSVRKVEICTVNGSVTVSENHRFLCVGGKGAERGGSLRARSESPQQKGLGHRWVKAKHIEPGDRIVFLSAPWGTGKSFEHGYLKGIADGEGCVTSDAVISIAQKPGDVSREIGQVLNDLGFHPYLVPQNGKNPVENWCISSIADSLRFLGEVRPVRLLKKSEHLYLGRDIARGRKLGKAETSVVVTSVKTIGEGPVVTLQTDTGTFVAEGMLSHNSETTIHFFPQDKRKLYRANKHLKEFSGAIDFERLAAMVNIDLNGDGKTTASELANLMGAASNMGDVFVREDDEEHIDGPMERTAADADWQPDVRAERQELTMIIKDTLFGLSMVERKFLVLKGVDVDSI